MSFDDLKKNSKRNFEVLKGELGKLDSSGKSESYKDDRFWKPESDKVGNGYAVIRFLPPVNGEDLPWVRVFTHGFKGSGGWYIENSLTTINKKDPVSEMNTKLWNSGSDADKEIARERKRRLTYISNILVVSDPKHPENEGKVFLFRYGKKIFDKIMEAMNPEFEDDDTFNPFDFWAGASFRLKIRKIAGFVNYDKSEFETPSKLQDGDDKKLEVLWAKQHPLKEFVDPSAFKSYDELKARLHEVLGGDERSSSAKSVAAESEELDGGDSETPTKNKSFKKQSSEVDADDALSYFERLASEN